MFSILRKVTVIVLIGLTIFLSISFILNSGIGTPASILRAERCSLFAFEEYSEYMEQSLGILLEARIYLELSEDYRSASIAYVFNNLEIKQKEISYPKCIEQLQAAQISYLHHQALAYSAKTKEDIFSQVKHLYHKIRSECFLNLIILIQTIIMPSVPPDENLFQNANLNIYFLGRDPFNNF